MHQREKMISIRSRILFGVILVAFARIVHTDQSSAASTTPTSVECRQQQSNCTADVYPYLYDAQYMFPTSLDHVNDMCKMWSRFVDCIRRYISQCFDENRRLLFHKSVENSIDTVHAICSSKLYQAEYLTKANCFKQVSMDHCGLSYQSLIDNIANPLAKDEHICCSYAQFKRCVNRPLLEECGRKAKNLMDHSMSFLISRCDHYSYHQRQQGECPQPAPVSKSIDGQSRVLQRITEEPQHNSIEVNAVPVPVSAESREWPVVDDSLTPGTDNRMDQDPDMIVYTMKPQSQVLLSDGVMNSSFGSKSFLLFFSTIPILVFSILFL